MARHWSIGELSEILWARSPRPGTSYLVQREISESASASAALPDGCTWTRGQIAGLAINSLEPPSKTGARTLLHLHGGAYVLGSLNTTRGLAGQLALHTGARVVTIEYRLAPEHPFPAGLEDSVRAYEALLDEGVDPTELAISGDSAGAGLAVATLLALRDAGSPLPCAAICLSPWSDLTLRGASIDANAQRDPLVSRWMLEEMASLYAGGAGLTTALASPAYADLSGLPPLLIQVGEAEVLLDDACSLASADERSGIDVTLERWPEMIHVWQAFAPGLLDGTAALENLATWLEQRW